MDVGLELLTVRKTGDEPYRRASDSASRSQATWWGSVATSSSPVRSKSQSIPSVAMVASMASRFSAPSRSRVSISSGNRSIPLASPWVRLAAQNPPLRPRPPSRIGRRRAPPHRPKGRHSWPSGPPTARCSHHRPPPGRRSATDQRRGRLGGGRVVEPKGERGGFGVRGDPVHVVTLSVSRRRAGPVPRLRPGGSRRLHIHAHLRIDLQDVEIPREVGSRRRLRVRGRRAAAPVRGAPRLEVAVAAGRTPASRWPPTRRRWPPPTPTWSRAGRTGALDGLDVVFWPCPTAGPSTWCPI